MANITTPVTSKPIASTVENDAYLLGIQKDGDNNLALFRMRLGEIRANTVNDTFFVPMLIDDYGAREAFRIFVAAYAEQSSNLTAIVSRFYAAAAKSVNETYTSTFYKFATSNTSDGTKADDNAQLVCTASTNATTGQDDYANLPLFMCFDCNYTIDSETLEPVITAIKDVTGTYSAAPADSLVGVLQMTGWVHRTTDETTKTVSYRGQQTEGYKPLPESVRASDNSVRPFVIHAKYAAGYNSAGKLSSVSGVQPATLRPGSDGSTSISYSGQIALWRQWGNQYGGSCLCDIAFLQLMLEIKYATLGSAKVLAGCRSYSYSYAATISESNVTRIIISKANAANLVVGSRVSIGTGTDRARSSCYNICDIATILSIEDYVN